MPRERVAQILMTATGGLFIVAGFLLLRGGSDVTALNRQPPADAPAPISDAQRRLVQLPPWIHEPDDLSPVAQQFTVTNETSTPVEFGKPKTSCGCTKAQLQRSALAPGESTTVDLEISIPSRPGLRRVDVTLAPTTGDPWKYRIEAPFYPRVGFDSRELSLSRAKDGERLSGRLHANAYAFDEADLPRIESVACDSDALIVTVVSEDVDEPHPGLFRRSATIELSAAAAAEGPGRSAVSARFSVPGRAAPVTVSSAVRWVAAREYEVNPKRLVVTVVNGQLDGENKSITIRRHDGGPFRIAKIDPSAKFLSCRAEPSRSGPTESTLTVDIDDSAAPPSFWGQLTVTLDQPEPKELKIPVIRLQRQTPRPRPNK